MPTTPMNRVIQHLLAACGRDGGGLTDGELLTRFLGSRDEDALAALVRRHAPMVWGVCCRMLRSHQDAEDAFQATFLVLVQKGAALPNRETVGNWLYGVARQTAVRMRAMVARLGARERQVAVLPEAATAERYVWNDLSPVVDEELSRLPDKYRVLVVLCDLEGVTRREVARRLGIPEGTAASRLAAARAMLAKRLTRRGIGVSGVLLGAVMSQQSAWATVPTTVITYTINAATLVAAGYAAAGAVSPTATALTLGVTKAMFMTKIKTVLAAMLLVGLTLGGIGAGIGLSAKSEAVAQQPGAKTDKAKSDAKEQPKQGDEVRKEKKNAVAEAPKAEKPKSYQGLSASLSVGKKGGRAGEPMQVTVTLNSDTDAHRLYNPFFNGLLERPGRIVIRDRDGKVVNRLLEHQEGSQRTPGKSDYVMLPIGGFVGAKLQIYPLRKALGGDDLPPGEYTMQLVLYGSLLSLGAEDDAKEIITTGHVPFRVSK